MRIIIFTAFLFGVLLSSAASSAEPVRYASIVIVEKDGEVLHARHADQLRYPASLSKLMTLYLLFDAIERGNVGLDDRLRVSDKAAKAKPSKLGLKSGTTISVEDAIRALVTKSANDVAIVVAERLAGGEARFASKMTKTAKLLGMSRSRFANGSGLPDKRQVSTARDMAVLAVSIRKDFPKFFHYFSLEKFVFDGRSFGNHNSLLGRIAGVDGLKTGFTNDAGYNIAVTVEREGVRLVVVVFGGASGAQRDAHARDLIDAAYKELSKRELYVAKPAPLVQVADLKSEEVRPPAGLPQQIDQGSADRRGVKIIIEGESASVPELAKKAVLAANWLIQVGAYSNREQAETRLQAISGLSLPDLATGSAIVQSSKQGDKTLFRARFTGLEQNMATRACIALVNRGQPCFPLAAAR
ncbi:MAG: D-alanyl-D-alanine carboxypeptidase [Robiginitomaculum sp.]|nr:D-alanyl-D-alanine carboxypeptidase [Robiginitomaculum sp.]